MKVWEETWQAEQEELVADDGSTTLAPWWNVRRSATSHVGTEFREEAAKLVSAAPEMARLLLLQLIPETNDDGQYFCRWCGEGAQATWGLDRFEHAADCPLVAVLRKAGVLDERGESK